MDSCIADVPVLFQILVGLLGECAKMSMTYVNVQNNKYGQLNNLISQ